MITNRTRIVLLVAAITAGTCLVGTAGAATGKAAMCFGQPVTIAAKPGIETLGTAGRDVIRGTPGPDVIRSFAEWDWVCGRGGNDRILTGPGIDRILAGPGDDLVVSGSWADTVWGGTGNDVLRGGIEWDYLLGGAGDDELRAGPGGDTLVGNGGHDRSYGGSGGDWILARGDGDTIYGEAPVGQDRVIYAPPRKRVPELPPVTVDLQLGIGGLTGSAVVDHISGVSNIEGTANGDVLLGDDRHNLIFGRAGDDWIDGRGDPDRLRGGEAGSDTCLNGEVVIECEFLTAVTSYSKSHR